MKKTMVYYIAALLVVLIWGTTFVSTKILLKSISPIEIMFYRYVIAYAVLFAIHPKVRKPAGVKEELLFVLAGIFGGTLYFLASNYALKYSLASNASLLLATAPMFTAVAAHFLTRGEKLSKSMGMGFAVAFGGTFLVIFNGHFMLRLNPVGDFLALASALSWALYSVVVKKIGDRYDGLYITRKIFFYSIVTMLPFLFLPGSKWNLSLLLDFKILGNLLFLGVLASSACYFIWGRVICELGAVKANNFIYLIPLLTMLFSALVLKEQITSFTLIGGVLILAGVYLSERGEILLDRLAHRQKAE